MGETNGNEETLVQGNNQDRTNVPDRSNVSLLLVTYTLKDSLKIAPYSFFMVHM